MPAEWEKFEEHVRRVFDSLLNLRDEGITVARNAKIKGRDGIPHQFDVFYQFSRGGVTHGVGIECKKTGRPVEKNDVMAFKAKVEDIPGLRGMIVAANGFQQGARTFADKNGVIAIEASELPGVGELLGARLESVALPDETTIGEPFWAIYEMRNGKNTGTPLGQVVDDVHYGFLFMSKAAAQRYLDNMPIGERKLWAVRGLPQRCLRSFVMTLDCFNGLPMIVAASNADGTIGGMVWTRKNFIEEFYIGKTPISPEPLVMPGWENRGAGKHRG